MPFLGVRDMIKRYRYVLRLFLLITIFSLIFGFTFAPTSKAEDAQEVSIAVDQDDLLDVVLTVGDTDSDVTGFEEDLRAALIEKGIPESKIGTVMIMALESSEVSTGNVTDGWKTYDHVTDNWSYTDYNGAALSPPAGATGPYYNHIYIYNGGAQMTFYGYRDYPFIDFMFMPNDSDTEKVFTFTMDDDNVNNHSMFGGGFLFNTSISNIAGYELNSTYANHSSIVSDAALISQYINGYLIMMFKTSTGSYPILYKINNLSLADFHDSMNSNDFMNPSSPGTGITVVQQYTSNTLQGSHDIRVEIDGSTIHMTDTVGATTKEFTYSSLLDTGSFGFGPAAIYKTSGHSCSRLSWFNFENLQMQLVSVRRFSEVIREPEWREGSKRFIVNAQDGAVGDFSDAQALGEILSRLGNDNIQYIGWGYDEADGQSFIDKNTPGGVFVDKDAAATDTYDEQISAIAEYIYSQYADSVENNVDYLLYGKPNSLTITPESEQTNTADENWPSGKWYIDHNPYYYENWTGTVPYDEIYLSNLDISFDETGQYDIYYQDSLIKTVYVHRKPEAGFSAQVDAELKVHIENNSYDPDFQSAENHGIASISYAYKETTATEWTSGSPETFEAEKEYIIRQIVTDNYGVESEPYYRYISTATTGDPVAPVAEFTVTPQQMLAYENTEAVYDDTSYDPKGYTIDDSLWTVTLNGSEIYSGNTPMEDFSLAAAGKYKISLKVMNSEGLWSETVARYLTVVRDELAPTASVVSDTPTGEYYAPITVSLGFEDEEDGSGFSHRYVVVTDSTTQPGAEAWGSIGTNAISNQLLNKLGTHYIHYKAYDNAGNERIGYFGPFTISDNTAPNAPEVSYDPEYTPDTWADGNITLSVAGSTDDFTADEDIVYMYSTNNVDFAELTSDILLEAEGTYNLYFKAVDEQGNESEVTSCTVKIDKSNPTDPTLTLTANSASYDGEWTRYTVYAQINSSEDDASGIAKYQYKINDSEWMDGDSGFFELTGEYTIYGRSVDNSGRMSNEVSGTVKVDKTDPEDFEITAESTAVDSIKISAETTDENSGLQELAYRINDGKTGWSDWKASVDEILDGYDRAETVTLQVEVRDNAGNTRIVSKEVTTLENTEPVAEDDEFELLEDDETTVLDVLDNDTDADIGTEPDDSLSVQSISELSDVEAGTLTLTEGVVRFTPAENYNGVVSFSYVVKDEMGAQDTAIATITVVPVNDMPTSADSTVQTKEDVTYFFTLADFPYEDIDSDPIAGIVVTAKNTDGSLYKYAGGAWSLVQNGDVILAGAIKNNGLKFEAGPDDNGTAYAKFKFRVSDGEVSVDEYEMTIDVKSVNDVHIINGLNGEVLEFTEDSEAQIINQGSSASVFDVDNKNFEYGKLVVNITNIVASEDELLIAPGGGVLVSGSTVSVNGQTVGQITSDGKGKSLSIKLFSGSTPANMGILLSHIAYINTNTDEPDTKERIVTFDLSDYMYDVGITTGIKIIPVFVPEVSTLAAQQGDIANEYASVGLNLSDTGGAQVSSMGIILSTLSGFDPATQGDKYEADSTDLGDAMIEITGLEPETPYYYVAFAINDEGVAYGSEQSFTTNASADTDGDGMIDDPEDDPDGDGIPSGKEAEMGSDPDNPDSTPSDKDGDGVLDDPKADSDGDGIIDEEEVAYGSNPNDPNSVPEIKTDWSFAGIGKFVWPGAGILLLLILLLILRNVKISYTLVDGLGKSKQKTIKKLVLGTKDNITITLGKDISLVGTDGMLNTAASFNKMAQGAEADLSQSSGFNGLGEIKLSKGLTKRMRNKSITIKYKDSEPITYHVRKSDGQNFIQKFEIK